MNKTYFFPFILLSLLLAPHSGLSQNVRIKDLGEIKGNRTNHLIGMGLVVGLAGTGDTPASLTTNTVITQLLTRLGISIEGEGVPTASVAAVVVTAKLPAFAKNGSKIDVKISVIGDATSLQGGTLLPSRLKAGDGRVYVVANGSIVMGPANGAGVQTLTSAVLTDAGMVEREFKPDLVRDNKISLTLSEPDFTTSSRVSEAINKKLRGFYAASMDPLTVEIKVPAYYKNKIVEFLSTIEAVRVKKDTKAVVVINERTGTIIMGSDISIQPVAISHGDLSIQVGEGANKKTVNVAQMQGATIGELLKSLNLLGLKPQDLVSILQGLKSSGALNATLKVI